MTSLPLRVARPLLIRNARLSDGAALCAACFPEEPVDNVIDYLQWCLAGEKRPARLVALEGEAIVGHVELRIHAHTTRWAELSSLVVTEARRGEGIGRRLVGAAQRLAQRYGCDELRLQVTAQDEALIAMYGRSGFTPLGRPISRYLWMRLPLAAQDNAAVEEPVSIIL